MLVTITDIEKLIQQAKQAGAAPGEIQELQEHLSEIKSGKLMSNADTSFMYEEIQSDGGRVVCVSTAPVSPEDDDDFEGVTFKPVKHSLPPKP
ncbi:hypothetical protein NDI37_02640 [Funiculus sociatus GB2-A5]|uniref:Uncharacterized protein n=1 Tax=Funiculus sociatus GB2-A5 TaxID=2933946 RepID=A0ABV0JIV0_9CYAN|nr:MULTISPECIES: hypothetical protein [unclassified Trichocoleus]MBD1904698.1 hypothetical protein [Trichocoleus sp. FACHB-832]MBD2062496.1 hypothetical protein [Trichocoleus sp. FACHB-6]